LIQIIAERIENKAKMYLGEDHYGFRRGVGTRDAITVMRVITKRRIEHNQTVYVCFVGYEKAFDRINWKKMIEILKNIGVDCRYRRLIKELYLNRTARVTIDNVLLEKREIGRGNRQGCPLSALLNILYDEAMIKKTVDGEELGITVGGECLHPVRFADDKAMLSSTAKGLHTLRTKLNDVSEEYGMKTNVKKTKIMAIVKKGKKKVKITINGNEREQVKQFRYLGSVITENGR